MKAFLVSLKSLIIILFLEASLFAQTGQALPGQPPETAPQNDIRGLKDLEHFSCSPLYYIAAIILVLIFGCLVWHFIRKWRNRKIEILPLPPVPPHELAIRELRRLLTEDIFQKKGEKHFHFRLSEIFREYLEGRFSFGATDMTTEEILKRLSDFADFDSAQKATIGNLLEETDKVKFADMLLGKTTGDQLVKEAETFVDETKKSENGDDQTPEEKS